MLEEPDGRGDQGAAGALEAHRREKGAGRICPATPGFSVSWWGSDSPSPALGSIGVLWPLPLLSRSSHMPHLFLQETFRPEPTGMSTSVWPWQSAFCTVDASLSQLQDLAALPLGLVGTAQAGPTQAHAPTPLGPGNPSPSLASVLRGSSVDSSFKVLGSLGPVLEGPPPALPDTLSL